MNIPSVPVNVGKAWVKQLDKQLQTAQPIQPQDMLDPSLLHPYGSSPKGAPSARQDCSRVLHVLDGAPADATLCALGQQSEAAAGRHGAVGVLAAVAGVAGLAGAVIGSMAYGPQSGWLLGGGLAGAAGLGLSFLENHRADSLHQDAALLNGWNSAIADGNPLRCPIPVSDGAVRGAYVIYCEQVLLGHQEMQPPTPPQL